MITLNDIFCPNCGGELKYYDSVRRLVRTKGGLKTFIFLERDRCANCGAVHRVIPENLIPYKHYEKEIITGVLSGLITNDILGYENYPCEKTMIRWISVSRNFQTL